MENETMIEEEGDAPLEAPLLMRNYSRHLLPIFCFIGIIGNIMALMLIRTNFWLRRLTSNIYLCTLSVCGCLFLFTVIVTWLDAIYELPLYGQSEVGCKMFTFMAHACDFICVWMISWISCDRVIVLYRPGIRKWVCTKKFARNLVIFTVTGSSVLYGWCLVFAGLETYPGTQAQYCGLTSDVTIAGYNISEHYFTFTMLDTILCTVIPSVLIVVVNSFSTYRYRQCMKIYSSGVLRVRFLRNPASDQPFEKQESTSTAKKLLLSQTQTTTQFSAQSTRSSNCGKLRSSDLQLSRSLLIVTSTFVLLNVPNYVSRCIEYLFAPQSSLFHLFHYMTFLFTYLHHAVLFYMYIFWSPQMKKQLKPTAMKLLECYCFKTVPEFGHHSAASVHH